MTWLGGRGARSQRAASTLSRRTNVSSKSPNNETFHNNFDLLRFLLAAMVFLFHLPTLSGLSAFGQLSTIADGNIAVLGFFAISGCVVSLSFERAASWKDYGERRARRLLPGYLAVVVICFLAGAIISTLPTLSYFESSATWKYLLANLTFLQFLQPGLPGVFATNPVLHAVNGSLWSIRTEILCYVLLPFLVTFRLRLPALVLFGCVTMFTRDSIAQTGIFHPLVSFLVGMYAPKLRGAPLRWLGPIGAFLLLGVHIKPVSFYTTAVWSGPLMPMCVAFAALALGLELPYLGNFSALGNLSYGMYLWHFPLIQFAISKGWMQPHPWLCAALLGAAVLIFAAASWRLVESPVLSRKSARA